MQPAAADNAEDSDDAIPLLAARSLGRRTASGQWLLHNLNFTLAAGERCGLVGPSGSGKTTLLRALCRLDAIDEGEVLWQGQPIAPRNIPAFRRQTVYLQQRATILPGTVQQNLALPFDWHSTPSGEAWSRQRAVELLQAAGLDEDFLPRDVQHLSGGERQLVAIVRALQLEPAVLLLDEPTTALDEDRALRVEQLLLQWCTERTTRAFVWVTHDAAIRGRVCNRQIHLQATGNGSG